MANNTIPKFGTVVGDDKFLTIQEADLRRPVDWEVAAFLEDVRTCHGVSSSDLRVLDFGCGRGALVGQLRNANWRAYGVDIDHRYIDSGRLIQGIWRDDFPLLSLVSESGRTVFPDRFFDAVISDQVLEHVKDIDAFVGELARILKPDGVFFLRCPGCWIIVEPHYFLPLVHWLPRASKARRAVARLLFALGLGVKFRVPLSLDEKTQITCEYADGNTFYRSRREVRNAFRQHGLDLDFTSLARRWTVKRIPERLPAFLRRKPVIKLISLNVVVELLSETFSWRILGFSQKMSAAAPTYSDVSLQCRREASDVASGRR
jgi:SAM-dependent methyltransferase